MTRAPARTPDRTVITIVLIFVMMLAVAMGLAAPLWAQESTTRVLAVLHLAEGRPQYEWVDEGTCEDYVAFQEQRALFVSVAGQPLTRVVMVECQCFTFGADRQEVTQ
jgi:hypothetical protein